MSHMSQKPSLYPVSQSEVDSREQIHMKGGAKSEELEMKSA